MRQLRKILVPVQFDSGRAAHVRHEVREALSWAVPMAAVSGGSITFVHVVASRDASAALPWYRAGLDALVEEARLRGVRSHWEFLFGNPDIEITCFADQCGYGLVVLGSPHELGVGSAPLGSTTMYVMLGCGCAVLVARAAVGTGRRLLIATDLSERDEVVLREGFDIARWRQVPVQVIHACRDRALAHDEAALPHLRSLLEVHVARALGGAAPPVALTTFVAVGDPSDVIWSAARRGRCDLVILGMAGRTGPARILQGRNTAELVVEDLPCSLMTVRC